jgi:hypothetical protein
MKNKILIFCVIAFLFWIGIMCIGSDGLSKLAKKLNPEKPNPDMIHTVADYNEFKWKFPKSDIDEIKSDRIDFLRLLISLDEAFPPPNESYFVSLSGPAKIVRERKSWSNSDLIEGKKYNHLVFNT